VLKSTIFTGSEFQAFLTRSLKNLLWFVRQIVFIQFELCPRVKVQVINEKKSSTDTSTIPNTIL